MPIGSHQSAKSKTNSWITPPEILEVLGDFDLDPAAALKMPWRTAQTMWTKKDDGLAAFREWFGRVWLNPPYSTELIKAFMARMADHGRGTALVFARTDTEWADKYVFRSGTASGVLFKHGRIHFHYPSGERAKANAGAPSMLVAYGAEDFDRLRASGINGTLLPISPLASFYVFAAGQAVEELPSWRDLLTELVERHGGNMRLQDVYDTLKNHAKTHKNPNWRAKVRQVLNRVCDRVGPAQYALAV